MISARYHLEPIAEAVDAAIADLLARDAVSRVFELDHTLFQDDPAECANRLGWLHVAEELSEAWPELEAFAAEIAAEADHVVLMGMGGSSLFPEVLTQTFGSAAGRPRLHVLDTTDPAAIRRVLDACPADRTFHLASSKSGSTLETRSHLAYFLDRSGDPSRFAVVTDPGSALGEAARSQGFRKVFENNPDIGGRYSALSHFGMVPAALIGADGRAMLDAANDMVDALAPVDGDDEHNLGLQLAAVIGAAALGGRDKLTILIDERVATFGLWLEQLIAESTGKLGRGIVPIVGESVDSIVAVPADRVVVTIGDVDGLDRVLAAGVPLVELSLEESTDIGAHVVLWEFAIALAGRVLGINPFDQPDVEAAKIAARRLLDSPAPAEPTVTPVADALGQLGSGDYLAICAFIDPGSADAAALESVRPELGRRHGVVTTLGFGPRFLHSTGQLHKGGANNIVAVQVVSDDPDDLAIPDQSFTFGRFKHAQATGDLEALHSKGHRALRVSLAELLAAGS